MSIKARLTALLLQMQQSRSDIYRCQVSGGQIEMLCYHFQPVRATDKRANHQKVRILKIK